MNKVIAFIVTTKGLESDADLLSRNSCNRPLIHWSLEALQAVTAIDKIVVATDNEAILNIIRGSSFARLEIYPLQKYEIGKRVAPELVMLEYAKQFGLSAQDILLLAGATCPFPMADHLTRGLQLFQDSGSDSLVSVVSNKRLIWSENGTPVNFTDRDQYGDHHLPGWLVENGAFYISTVGVLARPGHRFAGKTVLFEMPAYTALEFHESIDWRIAEQIMQYHRRQISPNEGYNSIKLLVSDVDGVLTDGSMYYTETGDEIKRFHTYDGMAFGLMQEKGIKTALITSEDTQMVANRAKKLKIDYLYQGRRHGGKLAAIHDICRQENIELSEVAYIGDDINCREALLAVGFAFCPANALPDIKALPNIIQLHCKGGEGAVREVWDTYLRGRWL